MNISKHLDDENNYYCIFNNNIENNYENIELNSLSLFNLTENFVFNIRKM